MKASVLQNDKLKPEKLSDSRKKEWTPKRERRRPPKVYYYCTRQEREIIIQATPRMKSFCKKYMSSSSTS
jgi:hypothetical protein